MNFRGEFHFTTGVFEAPGRLLAGGGVQMEDEEWRPVEGYEGVYSVSSLGRLYAHPRKLRGPHGSVRPYPGRIMKPFEDRDGYLIFKLARGDGTHQTVKLHRLVCRAFNGPAPEGKPLVLHGKNGVRDNSYKNLRWGDYSDNLRDAVRDGTHASSKKTHCKWGHEYTPENIGINNNGNRRCLTCHRHDRKKKRERFENSGN